MENQQEMTKITDNLLNVFNYSFVESVPYAFFIPKEDKYVAVNLVDKQYHCAACGKIVRVEYRRTNTGVTYFSKGRLARERRSYEKLGLDFPTMGELEAGVPFSCHVQGYCADCAAERLPAMEDAGQRICLLSARLHREDELLTAKARELMDEAVKSWLAGIVKAEQLLQYDLSSYEALRDLLCAVILQDTSRLEESLQEYLDTVRTIRAEIEDINAAQPEKWHAFMVRSTALYESMSDELYHEYTVAFPVAGTVGEDFYLERSIERDKVLMFLQQPRIASMEALLMDAGFQDAWVDALVEKGMQLKE